MEKDALDHAPRPRGRPHDGRALRSRGFRPGADERPRGAAVLRRPPLPPLRRRPAPRRSRSTPTGTTRSATSSDVDGVTRDEAYRFYRRLLPSEQRGAGGGERPACRRRAVAGPRSLLCAAGRRRIHGRANGGAGADRSAPRDRPQARAARTAHGRVSRAGASRSGLSRDGSAGRTPGGRKRVSVSGEVPGARRDTARRGFGGARHRREYGMAGVALSVRLQLLRIRQQAGRPREGRVRVLHPARTGCEKGMDE